MASPLSVALLFGNLCAIAQIARGQPPGNLRSTPLLNLAPTPLAPSFATGSCRNGALSGSLSVSGKGVGEATADVATVSLNIATTNRTADGAREVTESYSNRVISAVSQINGVFPQNVTTTSISVYPRKSYNSTEGTSATVGYEYTNYLSITLGNLTSDLLSEVLDVVVKNGGNNLTISTVKFSLSPELADQMVVEARTQAAVNAKATAQQYAKSFNVTLGQVLSATEGALSSTSSSDSYSSTNTYGSSGSNSSSSTGVSFGQEQVVASVNVVYRVCPIV